MELVTKKSKTNQVAPFQFVRMLSPRSRLFDNVSNSGSEVTVLSGPFSDFGHMQDHTDEGRYSEDLKDKDIFMTLPFSDEYRTVMNEIKNETPNEECRDVITMMAESPEQIKVGAILSHPKKKIPIVKQMKIRKLLNDKTYQFPPEGSDGDVESVEAAAADKKSWGNLKDEILGGGKADLVREVQRLKRRTMSKKQLIAKEEETYETMSGYWRLLSVYDNFRISPPHFDAYAQEEPHWLQTKPLPYEVYETSRSKCLEWLSKHFLTY